jgi:hypothetical protein
MQIEVSLIRRYPRCTGKRLGRVEKVDDRVVEAVNPLVWFAGVASN